MHRNFFLIVVFLSLFSCMGTVDRLEWALTLAGENMPWSLQEKIDRSWKKS